MYATATLAQNPRAAGSLAGPAPVSGVEQLNSTLSVVINRINRVAGRVGVLGNQFGAPPTDGSIAPSKEATNTNEYMVQVDAALTDLERIVSRIDNQ